jgi:hypothetical protein
LSHNSEEHHVLQDEPGIGDLSKVLTTTFSAASHIFSTFASDKPLMLHKLCTNKPDSQCATFCQGIVIMHSELGARIKLGKINMEKLQVTTVDLYRGMMQQHSNPEWKPELCKRKKCHDQVVIPIASGNVVLITKGF